MQSFQQYLKSRKGKIIPRLTLPQRPRATPAGPAAQRKRHIRLVGGKRSGALGRGGRGCVAKTHLAALHSDERPRGVCRTRQAEAVAVAKVLRPSLPQRGIAASEGGEAGGGLKAFGAV